MTDANAPSKYGDLSPSWQRKFEIFDSIGADRDFSVFSWGRPKEFRSLPYRDRMRIGFSIPAYLLGFVFYLAKGMWLKGVVILAGGCLFNTLIVLLEHAMDTAFSWVIYWVPTAAFYASLANYDYYLFRTQNEAMWQGTPRFLGHPAGALTALAIAFVVLSGVVIVLNSDPTPVGAAVPA